MHACLWLQATGLVLSDAFHEPDEGTSIDEGLWSMREDDSQCNMGEVNDLPLDEDIESIARTEINNKVLQDDRYINTCLKHVMQ